LSIHAGSTINQRRKFRFVDPGRLECDRCRDVSVDWGSDLGARLVDRMFAYSRWVCGPIPLTVYRGLSLMCKRLGHTKERVSSCMRLQFRGDCLVGWCSLGRDGSGLVKVLGDIGQKLSEQLPILFQEARRERSEWISRKLGHV
jgi:hypothetical protein